MTPRRDAAPPPPGTNRETRNEHGQKDATGTALQRRIRAREPHPRSDGEIRPGPERDEHGPSHKIGPEQIRPASDHSRARRARPDILPDQDPEDDPVALPVVDASPAPTSRPGPEPPAPTPVPSLPLQEPPREISTAGDPKTNAQVFVFRRHRRPPVSAVASPYPGGPAPRRVVLHPPKATGALAPTPPPWFDTLTEQYAGGRPATWHEQPEGSGFQEVIRLVFGTHWYEVAVVTLRASPRDVGQRIHLEALRDLEVATWCAVLEELAQAPFPAYPGAGARPRERAAHWALREPPIDLPRPPRELVYALPAGHHGEAWSRPEPVSSIGLVRPFLAWPTLADTGIPERDRLATLARDLVDRLRRLGARSAGRSDPLASWVDAVVDPEQILKDLEPWSVGELPPDIQRLGPHHFLVYSPAGPREDRRSSGQALLLPTQWRRLHRKWREAFAVHSRGGMKASGS